MFEEFRRTRKAESQEENLARLRTALQEADAVVIGAGSGLSTAAGYTYAGERFEKYFSDFREKYGITDIYSGGFYPYHRLEEYWAWWSRHIWVNRYAPIPKDTYAELYRLVEDKDYFVLTTNVDHCFQRAGFDKRRMFYTQGDYGLWQCSLPCHDKTYDNEDTVRQMLISQGYSISENKELLLPEDVTPMMAVPTELVPRCPRCGERMEVNIRKDRYFVEDEQWRKERERYEKFLNEVKDRKIVFLELGVGFNTPTIIRLPFEKMVASLPSATLVRVNLSYPELMAKIENKSVVIADDIGKTIAEICGA